VIGIGAVLGDIGAVLGDLERGVKRATDAAARRRGEAGAPP